MAEITYRGNLSASLFPLVSTYAGRSVIVGGQDQNYIRGLQVPQDGLIDENDKGIPQIMYCHNVMPSAQGWQSIGFNQIVGAIGGNPLIDNIYEVRDIPNFPLNFWYLAISTGLGTVYTLSLVAGVWTWLPVTVGAPANDILFTVNVTSTMVNGITYFLLSADAAHVFANPCRKFNFGTYSFDTVPLTGLVLCFGAGVRIKGNFSCFGYHLLFSTDTVAWSSLLDPTDFIPSLITGASFEKIQAARGQIVAVVEHELGFIIYTTANAVSGQYTGNSLRPFLFKEVTGVSGFPDANGFTAYPYDLISDDSNTNEHYAYTSSGIQKIGMNGIKTVHTDISDFIGGKYIEDFDETTRTFSYTKTSVNLRKRLNVILDRYLIISYGTGVFTYALIYDIITKRMGKIKFNHAFVFALRQTDPAGAVIGDRNSIAFMNSNGVVNTIDFDTTSIVQTGVMILGKFQYTRQRMTQLQHFALENVQTGATLGCYAGSAFDGKNPSGGFTSGYQEVSATNYRSWAFHKTAMNHTILLVGGFYASSFELKFNVAGKR